MHPVGWWVWAAGVIVLAGRTASATVLVVLALAAIGLAVLGRRPEAPPFTGYLLLAGGIVVVRLAFHLLVGVPVPGPVLLDLPSWQPSWAPGIDLLGPVTVTGLVGAAVEGLRLGVMVLAVGAAAAAASAPRLLRSLPRSLHHVATAAAIAVGVAPSLAEATAAARRARRLRGLSARGPRALAEVSVPVLAGALDRSLALAASMDSRGFARLDRAADPRVLPAVLVALLGGAIGTYGLLTGAAGWAATGLGVGLVSAVGASVWAGRTARRTTYRAQAWSARDWWVTGTGAASVLLAVLGAPSGLPTALVGAGLLALTRPRLAAVAA